ncbi:MAG: hypothetical protein EOP56_02740 [Sphingobacteriales bacterium]|nr:MAG: hypothetical protein EOP56_02740 [Sphingobacteriales bacterium]
MKSVNLLLTMLLVMTWQLAFARKGEKDCVSKDPLPKDIFNRMIVNDITYAIVGEHTPVSGIKVDVSKPEATISGVFRPKKDKAISLIGFEFKGGVTDRNFSFLKGNGEFNTAFEIRPSFYIIPERSSGKYGVCPAASSMSDLINARHDLADKNRLALRDTFNVLAFLRHHHMAPLTDWEAAPALAAASLTDAQKEILIYFIETSQGSPGFGLTKDKSTAQILAKMPDLNAPGGSTDMKKYNDKVFLAYEKYKKAEEDADEALISKKIANASHIWTKKSYWWYTVAPFARTEKVNQYYTKYEGKDSLYFKPDYQFYGGLSLYANHYIVFPKKTAHLIRFGLTGSYANNLTTLTSFNYETATPFFAQGQSVTDKVKAGTAYNNDDIKTALMGQVNLEYYLLPLNTLVPGFYFSSNLNVSDLYKLPKIAGRTEDMTQFSLETGLVFNVNSREKDKEKSIFSLLFYIRHEDLTDKRRTPVATMIEESKEEFMKRNVSVGVRVGIPINLPQRQ